MGEAGHRAEVDPYGMTNKKGKSNSNGKSKSKSNGKDEIQGFFAALRMTT